MVRGALLILALLAAAPAMAKALKVIEALPRDVLGAAKVTSVEVTVGDAARAGFEALEKKAADKRERATPPPPAGATTAPNDAYATLPFAQMLPRVLDDELAGWGLSGTRPIKLAVQLDTLKTADAGAAMLLGSVDELAGIVTVSDAASGAKLGEFYVDVLNTRGGLLGLAMRGSGVREKLAAEFSKHVGEALSGRRNKGSKELAVAAAPASTSAKTITYPIEPDIMAKTEAEIGLAISPAPMSGADDILLAPGQAADHDVTRASMMQGSGRLVNPVTSLLRGLAVERDKDGRLDDGAGAPGTLTIALDTAATLSRCVTTGELKGTCIVRITLAGSAQRTGEAQPRPIAVTLERNIKGIVMSHSVAVVSREAALQFLAAAEHG